MMLEIQWLDVMLTTEDASTSFQIIVEIHSNEHSFNTFQKLF